MTFWLEEVLKHPITHLTKEWYQLISPPSKAVRGLRNYHRDPFLGRLSYTKSGNWRYHSDAYETCYPRNYWTTYYSVSLGPEKKGVVFINRVQQPITRSVQLLYWLSHATKFSQINLVSASFWSTFSRESGTPSVCVRIHSTILTKRKSRCNQNIVRNAIF